MNDDLISRAAAIEALGEEPPVWYDGEDEIAERNQWRRDVTAIKELPPAQQEVRTQMPSADCISRQSAIDRINKQRERLRPDIYEQDYIGDAAYRICAEFIERLPSAQPDGGLEQNKDKILQAGMEGREIDFRIGGRLFAIREKAQ